MTSGLRRLETTKIAFLRMSILKIFWGGGGGDAPGPPGGGRLWRVSQKFCAAPWYLL